MPTFKIHKNKNYTIMSNYHLQDKNLTLKAKGLLSYMLSLPENWDYSLMGLSAICKEGIRAIRNIIQELEKYKYIKRVEERKNGQYKYNYEIYEKPYSEVNINNSPYVHNGHTVTAYPKRHTKKY